MSDEEIYLISPPFEDYTRTSAYSLGLSSPSPPLGLLNVASHADDNGYGGMIKVIDGGLLSYKHGMKKAMEMISQDIKEGKPFVTGLSTFNLNFDQILKLVKTAYDVDSTVVYGGNYATTLHRIFARSGIVVRNDGEDTFKALLDEIYFGGDLRKVEGITFFDGKEVVVNPDRAPVDINNISFPYWGLLQPIREYGYTVPIEESRRCYWDCSFCSIALKNKDENGKKILPILKIPERIEVEAELAYAYGAKWINFISELTLLNRERALKIADIMDKYGFFWDINAHPTLVLKQQNILPILNEKGLMAVEMGVEGGCQSVLDYYNKQTTPEINSKAMKILEKNGITSVVDFINFHPDITMEELGENIVFIGKHLDFFSQHYGYPHDNIFKAWIALEGTPMYERLFKEDRIIIKDENPFGRKTVAYRDSGAVQVIRLINHYTKHHHPTYEKILHGIYKEIREGKPKDSLPERNSRLKKVPFIVLSTAYSYVRNGELMEEAKKIIDSYCQEVFTALSQHD